MSTTVLRESRLEQVRVATRRWRRGAGYELRRWMRPRRWHAIAAAVLIVLLVLELIVSNQIARKLEATVTDRTNAELYIARLWYLPPMGARVCNAVLMRD